VPFLSVRDEFQPDETRHPRLVGRAEEGVESNVRLTASTAAVLFVLLAVEGVTILSIRKLLTVHVFIGMLLIPPALLKIGSTSWRFVRYYLGSPGYRRKGPPPVLLRMLGPVLVVLTASVFVSGVTLILVGPGLRQPTLLVHKASFVLWFGAMTVHVLGHIAETARIAPGDWLRRSRTQVAGAGLRLWALATSLVVGALLGLLALGHMTNSFTGRLR
jgi:hypothetical protein